MRKVVWFLVASLSSASPALADPPSRPVSTAPYPPPKGHMAVSPILNADTREIMMPGKGMPKKRPPRAH